jgi:hypothetical protein
MKFLSLCLGFLCATFNLQACANTLTLTSLLTISPFNLLESPPTRADLNVRFGAGHTFTRGEGGERFFAQCYSVNKENDSHSVITVAFLFKSTKRSTHASGVLATTEKLGCKPIKSNMAYRQLLTSDVFKLFKLNPTQMREVAPSGGIPISIDKPEENFIMVYEFQKLIQEGMAMHSPEAAYALHRNRTASYRLDISTSIESEFHDQKMKATTVWLQTSY